MVVEFVFFIIAALIIIGFLADYFFDRIKIPDSLILITLGILLGPVANYFFPNSMIAQMFNPAVFESFSSLLASLAITVIMFETGLSLDIKRVITEAPRSFFYGTAHYFSTAILVAVFVRFLLGFDWVFSLMVGFLLGGTSAAIVIPLAKRLNILPEEQTIIELESTITNIYNVVFVLALAQYALSASLDWRAPVQAILSAFSISIVIGALAGYFWQKILKKLMNHPFSYMLTFSVLLVLYAFTNLFGGNGPLTALVFGITMANLTIVPHLKMVRMYQLHREISFFIRVFFFVFLGVIFKASANPMFWLVAGIIAAISVAMRYLAAVLMEIKARYEFAILIPRGLSEAVLSAILLSMFASTPHFITVQSIVQIVSITIIWTNILTAILVRVLLKLRADGKIPTPVTEETTQEAAPSI